MAISLLSLSGPVMTGPSSSHTAGALKIGRIARSLYGKRINKVRIYLHGSFAQVYKGHATDRAILGGILGMETDDPKIAEAFEIAEKENLKFEFIPTDFGEKYHPNTARIEIIEGKKKPFIVTGASVGGGSIRLTGINQFPLNLREPTGKVSTLIVVHQDRKGVLSEITKMLTTQDNNIGFIHSERQEKDGEALTIIETDDEISPESINELKQVEDVQSVFLLQ
jgi:L-serine dehydratase